MEIAETIKKIIQEIVVPEFDQIRAENAEIKAMLHLTNKRLDDINAHLVDQSRRIDETNRRIDETNKRIDETNKRIEELRADLYGRIDETNKRIEELRADLYGRIDELRADLYGRIDELRADLVERIDRLNSRVDRLYEVIVRRDEHEKLEFRVMKLEQDVAEIKTKIAA
ncbi:MAG: hypothetical protein OHK0032_08810 [Thermodesulfovibrionales bacterium]